MTKKDGSDGKWQSHDSSELPENVEEELGEALNTLSRFAAVMELDPMGQNLKDAPVILENVYDLTGTEEVDEDELVFRFSVQRISRSDMDSMK